MNQNQNQEKCGCKKVELINGFSLKVRIIMHSGIYLFALFGTLGIGLENWKVGLAYLAFVIFSFRVLLIGMFCRYCPYPFKYNSCMFFPIRLFKNITPKSGKAPFIYRFGHLFAFGGMFIAPQFWIYNHPYLAVGFWVTFLVICLGMLIRMCGRCRYEQCPFNRVPKEVFQNE